MSMNAISNFAIKYSKLYTVLLFRTFLREMGLPFQDLDSVTCNQAFTKWESRRPDRAWSQVIDGGETQPLARLRIWPRFVTVAFSNSAMVYLSRSRHNGVPQQGICIQILLYYYCIPLPPLYHRSHWRRGQEASGWTNSYFFLHPRPLSKSPPSEF